MSRQESGDLVQWHWSFAKVVRTLCPPGEWGGRVGHNSRLFRDYKKLMMQRMLGRANSVLPGLPWG